MFTIANFNAALAADNDHYERHIRSELHDLVLAARGAVAPTAMVMAPLVNAISREKWRKYSNVKQYLLHEIAGLAPLVRAHLGSIVTFRTHSMQPGLSGRIEHVIRWGSSVGVFNTLNNLAHVRVHEHVQWGAATPAAQPYLMPEYQIAGAHNGLGFSFGNTGRGSDGHDPVGPFTSALAMVYTGPLVHAFVMNQTYEYSDDGGRNWVLIPNSAYTITRQLSSQGAFPRFTITKTAVMNPADTVTNYLDLLPAP